MKKGILIVIVMSLFTVLALAESDSSVLQKYKEAIQGIKSDIQQGQEIYFKESRICKDVIESLDLSIKNGKINTQSNLGKMTIALDRKSKVLYLVNKGTITEIFFKKDVKKLVRANKYITPEVTDEDLTRHLLDKPPIVKSWPLYRTLNSDSYNGDVYTLYKELVINGHNLIVRCEEPSIINGAGQSMGDDSSEVVLVE